MSEALKNPVGITDKRSNCLNLLRLVAAIQVFWGHVIPVFNTQMPGWIAPLEKVMFLFEGVPFFFGISGFLLWMSLEKTKTLKQYLKNRVARLYPEMWGAIILNAAVILVVKLGSLNWVDFFAYQFTQSTIFQFWTPDSLRDFANGPLWTVCVMVQCYVALWFLHRFLHKKGLKRWIPTLVICVAINLGRPLLASFLPAMLYKLIWYTFFSHIWLFLAGAFICEYFDRVIPYLKKLWPLAFAVEALVFYLVPSLDFGDYPFIKSISLLLGAIGFAYCFKGLAFKVDLSYGLYLYHMIVVNLMVFLGFGKSSPIFLLIALVISLGLSAVSYFSLGAVSRRIKKRSAQKQAA